MSAIISDCGRYRYRLDRDVRPLCGGPVALLIGVNPSTADATTDDATIRKDMGFAERLGWSRIIKGNKFAWRATDVRELAKVNEPTGEENDYHLRAMMDEAGLVVACWGPIAKLPKPLRNRWRQVAALAEDAGKPLMCFGTASDGQPRHTLMLPYATPLVSWEIPA